MPLTGLQWQNSSAYSYSIQSYLGHNVINLSVSYDATQWATNMGQLANITLGTDHSKSKHKVLLFGIAKMHELACNLQVSNSTNGLNNFEIKKSSWP